MSSLTKHGAYLHGWWNAFLTDNIFSDFPDSGIPAVNVVEKDDDFEIALSLPGFDKKNIALKIDKNVLKVSAKQELNDEKKDPKRHFLRCEFRSSAFERSFVLPDNIDTANIAAKQENGVLTIALPKLKNANEDSVKEITIK